MIPCTFTNLHTCNTNLFKKNVGAMHFIYYINRLKTTKVDLNPCEYILHIYSGMRIFRNSETFPTSEVILVEIPDPV